MKLSGSRLKTARLLRGLTQTELASAVGTTQPSIRNYETGASSPKDRRMIYRLALALTVRPEFLTSPGIEIVTAEAVTFRSRRSLRKLVRDSVLANATIASQVLHPEIERHFVLPEANMPRHDEIAGATPDVAAEQLRAIWGIADGPVTNLTHHAEANGVGIYYMRGEQLDAVDAVSWSDPSGRPFALTKVTNAGERMRFSLAHEIGHMLLHLERGPFDSKRVEDEANTFASCLLLPRSFLRECPSRFDIGVFLQLKRKWKVSLQAMIRRASDGGAMDKSEYTRGMRVLSAKWGRRTEPGTLAPERSKIMPMIFESLGKRGVTPDDFALSLDLHLRDLRQLIPSVEAFEKDDDSSHREVIAL